MRRSRVSAVPSSHAPAPFFSAGAAAPAPRLLLISYHFPPGQAAGALRWQKLARYVEERGWGLDVITLDPSSQSSPDWSRLAELPAGTRVYGVPAPDPWFQRLDRIAGKALRWLRSSRRQRGVSAHVSTHDVAPRSVADAPRPALIGRDDVRWTFTSARALARAYHVWFEFARDGAWARRAAHLARRLLEPGSHEAIITSGPPHMAHEAGRLAAVSTRLPFVMDLRDPWSVLPELPEVAASPMFWRLAAYHEQRAVAQATLVVMTTELSRLAMCAAYPAKRANIITVTNGFDDEVVLPPRRGHRFTLAYAGAVYIDRTPRLLFRAAARLVREFQLAPTDFRIEFIGSADRVEGVTLPEMASQEGLAGYVHIGPPRPHRGALEFLAQAAMLLSLPQGTHLAIPSKIFEYMQFDAWLLVLAERGSATELLLRETSADVVPPHDVEAIAAVLRKRYAEHVAGVRPTRLAADHRFSRRAQARLLLDSLAACRERGSGSPAVSAVGS